MPDETNQAPGSRANQNSDQNDSGKPASALNDLKDKITDDMNAAKDAVKDGADSAMQKVQSTVAEQTNFAAHQVGGIATALRKVGAELERGDQPEVGRYAQQIGESVQAIAKKIEGRDLGEIANMAEDFGRKQPLAFLGVAALAGLAASRFLTASAKRTSNTATSMPKVPSNSDVSQVRSFASTGGSDNG